MASGLHAFCWLLASCSIVQMVMNACKKGQLAADPPRIGRSHFPVHSFLELSSGTLPRDGDQ
uniref:Uncharacterized protein n=1 Tax=Arundo donax TaxID=35708 RepID=A0A0A9C9M4_ARUDO